MDHIQEPNKEYLQGSNAKQTDTLLPLNVLALEHP